MTLASTVGADGRVTGVCWVRRLLTGSCDWGGEINEDEKDGDGSGRCDMVMTKVMVYWW